MTPEEKSKKAEESLREATREAHEAIKDLRFLIQQSQGVIVDIHNAAQVGVDERITPILKSEIAKLGDATKSAMREAVEKVGEEFQRLEDILLGQDKQSKRQGKSTIPELIERRGKK